MRAMSDTDRKDPAREILQGLFACVLEDILKYGILCVDNRFFVSYTVIIAMSAVILIRKTILTSSVVSALKGN